MNTRLSVLIGLTLVCILAFCSLASHAQAPKALLLFGGKGHKTFLGCLNCVDTSAVSICNEFGQYGSEFQSDSIWNGFGQFGSEFRTESPWNEYSNDAPIIVDKDGNSYGYFSANQYHHDRTHIAGLVAILDYYDETSDLDKTRKVMCGD